jgi:hypothetical protein
MGVRKLYEMNKLLIRETLEFKNLVGKPDILYASRANTKNIPIENFRSI